MAERIEVDPYELKRASAITVDAAAELKRIVTKLRGALALESDTTNFPWGNDSFGGKFAGGTKGYKVTRKSLLESGDALASGAVGFADGQVQAALLMIASDEKE
ncbi:hypothetical protein [Nocardia sp. A7]|uniref:hypothetical protein n=1 Tax=Nocardia sp. A7 TaxID=2789274 RepID=UPI0039780048